jgi:peptidoglycan/LPS O-acetylase OafA/YrhL
MKPRLGNIQALRGIAALMVLVAHVKEAEGDYGGAGALLPHWLYMGVVGVDLFFLISGFVMVYVASAAPHGARAAARFLFNRAARIYPLYWAVTLILIALYAGKHFLFAEATSFPNPVETFLLLPDSHYPLLPVGWTLVHEMYFYSIFAAFIFLRRKTPLPSLAIWLLAIIVANALGWTNLNAWSKIAFSPLTYEFIAGAFVAILIQRGVRCFATPALLIGVGIIAVETAFFADALYPDIMGAFTNRAILFGTPFAFILYGAAAIENQTGKIAPRWLRKTGDASYSLYLIHVPVFLVVGKLVSIAFADGITDNFVLISAFLTSALGAGFLLHTTAEKPLLENSRPLGDKLFSAQSQSDVPQSKAW